MTVTISKKLRGLTADALALGWFDGQRLQSHPLWSQLPVSTRTAIQRQLKRPGSSLEWGASNTVQLQKGPWATIVMIGLGKKAEWTSRRHRLATRRLVRQALLNRWSTVVLGWQGMSSNGAARAAEQAILAAYDYRAHKQQPPKGWPAIKQLTFVAEGAGTEQTAAVRRGVTIGTMANLTRDLANTPGGLMTPTSLAAAATNVAREHKLQHKVLTPLQMQRLKMGALLGVGQGSDEEPRLIILEYHGGSHHPRRDPSSGRRGEYDLAFIGKGITFDSGGYNLKPSNAMNEMHMDMSGGAAVIGAMAAIAELRLPVNVVAIIPAAENMVSGSGFRPGDILKSMSGLNIEIGNTDAEGRLVLADGLTYAQKFYQPKLMVDVATLTGAALVALGQEASALLTKDTQLQQLGQEIGEASGDYVWPLPMWEEYQQLVSATFGDVTNSGKFRWGGTIEGAMFLSKFVKDTPWIHLDIAPTMSSIEGQHLAPGATGSGVRWLVELARRAADGTLPSV